MRPGLPCLLFACAIAAGCGDPDGPDPDFPIGLDRVRDLGVSAAIAQPRGDQPRTLDVRVGGDAICIAAGSEFAVTLPGATTTMLNRGRHDEDFCGGGFYDPSALLVLDENALPSPAILTVGDEYHTVQLDLGDLLAPRAATLVAPADGVLHSGQAFEVAWTPGLGVGDVSARAHIYAPSELTTLAPVADGDTRLTGTAPAFTADRDDAELAASLRGFRSVSCEGARCSVGGTWSATFPVALRRD
jgi:hypothetical protein